MAHQANKPNNETFNSIGRPGRTREKGSENQAQEFINETEDLSAPSTAQGGKQTPVKKGPHTQR